MSFRFWMSFTLVATIIALGSFYIHWWMVAFGAIGCALSSLQSLVPVRPRQNDLYLKPSMRPLPLTVENMKKDTKKNAVILLLILPTLAAPMLFLPYPRQAAPLIEICWWLWSFLTGFLIAVILRMFTTIEKYVEVHNQWLARMGPTTEITLDF